MPAAATEAVAIEPITTTATPEVSAVASDHRSFAELGIDDDLIEVLARKGIEHPSPVQSLTIPDALAGHDVCGRARTGSGKTLAFGLPLVMKLDRSARSRSPRALVLVPTRELAGQVADELAPLLAARRMWVTAIYGGASPVRQIRALREGVEVVVATPGRLNDLLANGSADLRDVQMVVIDEADQMADMGFLPQVHRILRQIETKPQTLLFSATLDGDVATLVREYQDRPVRHEVAAERETADTLEQRFIGVTSNEKIEATARVCAGASRVIVFVSTQRGADRLTIQLQDHGLRAAAIHGRLSQSKRERTLAGFASGQTPVLVATNVAARGLHVDGVDLVVHYNPPEDEKVYLHRSGRTARAGAAGLVVTLVLPDEVRDVTQIQRAAGIDLEVVPMRVNDPRLNDLLAWSPPARARVEHDTAPSGPRRPATGSRARSGERTPSRRPRVAAGTPAGSSGNRKKAGPAAPSARASSRRRAW